MTLLEKLCVLGVAVGITTFIVAIFLPSITVGAVAAFLWLASMAGLPEPK